MLLSDRFRDIDGKEFWLASARCRRSNGVPGDLAVQRAYRHERIDGGVARHLGDLIGGELRHRHLLGINTRFGEYYLQQSDVCLRPTDNADATSGEFIDA